ncbi:hypothetical protein, partial [Bradyrhizobium sp.]|uniref:hypothetical protein n=1 Tax=Bradyrhizobium sp. TaxID=376 RepID=UPI0025C71549
LVGAQTAAQGRVVAVGAGDGADHGSIPSSASRSMGESGGRRRSGVRCCRSKTQIDLKYPLFFTQRQREDWRT